MAMERYEGSEPVREAERRFQSVICPRSWRRKWALACAIPVVATDVGGIPEQIKGLQGLDLDCSHSNRYGSNDATGVLVPSGNAEAMAESIRRLLGDDSRRWQLGKNAAKDARQRFDIEQQAEHYLTWYAELTWDVIPHNRRLREAL